MVTFGKSFMKLGRVAIVRNRTNILGYAANESRE